GGELVPNFLGYTTDCDLNAHACIMPALQSLCKQCRLPLSALRPVRDVPINADGVPLVVRLANSHGCGASIGRLLCLLLRPQAQLLLDRQRVESRPLVLYPAVHDPPYRDAAHFEMLAGGRQAIALTRVRATGYPVDRYQIALSDQFLGDNAQIRK